MLRKLLMLLLISLVLGCGDSKKGKEKKTEEIKEQVRTEQIVKNMMRENDFLLAAKYEISEDQLTQILIDYEKMTQVFSAIEVLKAVSGKDIPKVLTEEPVDVPTALNRISEKYGISKKNISTIILERKILAVSLRF